MKIPIIKNLNIKLTSLQKWGIYLVLFLIAHFISQHFAILKSFGTSIQLSVGIAFLAYINSPVRQWKFIFSAQILLTLLLTFKVHDDYILVSIAQTFTSLISASIYKIVVNSNVRRQRIHANLILPVSAGLGSLFAGCSMYFFNEQFRPEWFHSGQWVTWTLSGMIGILIIPQFNFGWKSFNIKEFFLSQKKSIPELGLLIFSTLIVTNLIFSNKIIIINLATNFPYFALPLLFWAGIRFHPLILCLLLFTETYYILQYISVAITPYVEAGLSYNSIINSLQVYILFTIEFSYVMAHVVITRNQAQEDIKKLNESLEANVSLRTDELKQALEALGQSEEQFREAFETAMHGMALVRLDGTFIRVNQALSDMIGYNKSKILSLNLQRITYPEDFTQERKKFRKLATGSIFYYQIEKRLVHRNKLAVWVLASNSLITSSEGTPLRIVSQIIDITDRKQSENQLTKYSETLTILLREVNHRVKNNLSALIGMLHLEEDKAEKGGKTEYINLLKDLTSRIQGLATVHSMLSAINWGPLELNILCERIVYAVIHGLPLDKAFTVKISPSAIKINSNQSHHLAIVLNELATNSVKYGSLFNPEGRIDIQISQSNGLIHLQYKDNGPGYPEPLLNGDYSAVHIGLELVRGIITQSLDGEFKLRNDMGAIIEIWFQNELG